MEDADLDRLAAEIRVADTVVAFTGAGISAPSGVPTFRGDDGVWERFDEGQFTYGRFRRDPEGFWRDRLELQRAMFGGDYRPNAAHRALADLGTAGHLSAIVTQNTDGLHADAADDGSDDTELIELHGNARRVVCTDCGGRLDAEAVLTRVADGEVPPRCECGGALKPDVVLFGEPLHGSALDRSRALAATADVFLAIGSSLVVEPAASLPRQAFGTGATLAIVDVEGTPLDGQASFVFRDDVVDVLPRIRERVFAE